MAWSFKLSFNEDILAFFGLATDLAIFFQSMGEIFVQSSGHTTRDQCYKTCYGYIL